MEKKFLKLETALALLVSISTESNADGILNNLRNIGRMIFPDIQFTYSTGVVCDRYEKKTFVGLSNGEFVKATNFTEAFCGIKSTVGVEWDGGYCSCVDYTLGLYTDGLDDVIENTANNSPVYTPSKKAIALALASFAWNAWNVWNNANAVINYLGNVIKNIDIDININDLDFGNIGL